MKELIEFSKVNFEKDEVLLAIAILCGTVALYIKKRVSELVVDDDGVAGQKEGGFSFLFFSFVIAVDWHYRLN